MRPLDNRVISQIRHFLLGKSFGNRNHPIRKRDKALNKSIAAVGRPCQRNFRRTAADVKHQRPLDVTAQQRNTADNRQTGFFFGRNDFDIKTGFFFHQIKKLLTVNRPPAGRRSHIARLHNRSILGQHSGTYLKRADGTFDRCTRKFVVVYNTLPQTGNLRKSLNNSERRRGRSRNNQPAGIGA